MITNFAKSAKKIVLTLFSFILVAIGFQNCSGSKSTDTVSGSNGSQGSYNNDNSSVPTNISNEKVVDISTMGNRTCAVLESGKLKCWGSEFVYGSDGFIDFGKVQKVLKPKTISDFGNVKSVAGSGAYFCAVTTTNKIKCFGLLSGIFNYSTPTEIEKALNVKSIDANATYFLIHSNDSSLQFVGEFNPEGKNNYAPYKLAYEPDTFLQGQITNLVGASTYYCARAATDDRSSNVYGKLTCVGNYSAPLGAASSNGYGNIIDTIPGDVRQFALAEARACAVNDEGQLYCWGNNIDWTIANFLSSQGQFDTPARFEAIHNDLSQIVLSGVKEVQLGTHHSCVLMVDSTVKCWGGYNLKGQLGNGTTQNSLGAVQTVLNLSNVTKIAVGYDHTCALINDGSVKCWGSNNFGQLGDGTLEDRLAPIKTLFTE